MMTDRMKSKTREFLALDSAENLMLPDTSKEFSVECEQDGGCESKISRKWMKNLTVLEKLQNDSSQEKWANEWMRKSINHNSQSYIRNCNLNYCILSHLFLFVLLLIPKLLKSLKFFSRCWIYFIVCTTTPRTMTASLLLLNSPSRAIFQSERAKN